MGTIIDSRKLSSEQLASLMEYITPLLNIADHNQEQDTKREAVDRAIKQDDEIEYSNYVNNTTVRDEEEEFDEFSSLYEPLLLKLYRSWVVLSKNACFPLAGEWMDIKRKSSTYFRRRGLHDFLPHANEAWKNVINTENYRFGFKKKYSIGLAECIAYGNTGCVHYYNTSDHYMDIKFPGIRNISVYPSTNLWQQSNLIVRYDVPYTKMLKRQDLDQEYISAIVPSQLRAKSDSSNFLERGSTKKQEDSDYEVPYGCIRNYDIYIPSIYLKGKDGEEPFVAENVYITLAYQPELLDDVELDLPDNADGNLILKIEVDVKEFDHGILLASAGTTLPGVFFHQGMLIPFLSHQMLLNQQFSAMGRVTSLLEDPPLELVRSPDAEYDQTPPEDLVPGAMYRGFNVRAIIPPEYYQVLDQFIKVNSYVTNSVESGSGLSKAQLAGITSSRTSASEVREAVSAGGLNVGEFVDHIDTDLLTPSYVLRIQGQQEQLRVQVESALEESVDLAGDALETILEENELFQKILDFSNIEELYENFYNDYKAKQVENDLIKRDIASTLQRIQEIQQAVQADIPPPPASPVAIDPQTGAVTPSQQEQDQMEQMYYDQMIQQKQQMLQEAQQLEVDAEKKQLQLEDLPDIPEPSLTLYYEMMAYPIKDSDIVATGARTTVAKDYTRQFLKEWTAFISALGPEGQQELDPEKLIKSFTKTTNFMLGDVTRDSTDKQKMKAAAEAAMMRQQQIEQVMLQNPGSQPPKFG